MPEQEVVSSYELRVAGSIGPVVASALPGFVITGESTESCILIGTVADAEGLVDVMNVLNAYGFSQVDTVIKPSDLAQRPKP